MYVYTVYSVCCRYTSCNLKQKQGSNCLLSIRRKWFLFIRIVPGNIVDFWNSDFLKKSQLDLPSAWIFFLYLLLCMNFFLGIFPCMNFFCSPPHHFSHGPSLTNMLRTNCGKRDYCRPVGQACFSLALVVLSRGTTANGKSSKRE